MEDKKAYQNTMEERFREIGARIDDLQARATHARDEVKDELRQHVNQLQAKRTELQQKLNDMNSSGAEAWSSIQEGVHAAWDELNRAFQDAVSTFDQEQGDRTENQARGLVTDQRRHDQHQHDTMLERSQHEIHSADQAKETER